MVSQRPCISDVTLFESFDVCSGAFLGSLFTCVDPEEQAWIGRNDHIRKHALADADLETGLPMVADDKVFPQVPDDVTLVSTHLENYYIKRPQIHHLLNEAQAELVPKMFLDEVYTHEFFKRHPQKHIVAYHGCVTRRGRITGIALARLPKILEHRFFDDASKFDVLLFENDLRDAAQHIHKLGLAHNDLNPSNIGLDDDDRPVVLDWGSCKRIGEDLDLAGTPPWVDMEDDCIVSKREHDTVAIDRIVRWVREQKDHQMMQCPALIPTHPTCDRCL